MIAKLATTIYRQINDILDILCKFETDMNKFNTLNNLSKNHLVKDTVEYLSDTVCSLY